MKRSIYAVALASVMFTAALATAAPQPTRTTTALKAPAHGNVAIADLNGDQRPEYAISQLGQGVALFQTKQQWFASLAVSRAALAIGDIDGDGKKELVVPILSHNDNQTDRRSEIVVLNANGRETRRWKVPGEIGGSVVLKDLDRDGPLEIIVATLQGQLLVYNHKGQLRQGFPKPISNKLDSSEVTTLPTPAVGELDGDATNGPEIAVTTNGGELYAFHNNGESLAAFPIKLDSGALASPLIGDIDGDGRGEILAISGQGTVEWRRPDGTSPTGFPVKLRQPVSATPVAFDLNRDGTREIYVATLQHMVFGISVEGRVLPGWPRDVKARVYASPLIGDANGDGSADLLIATQAGKLFAFQRRGQLVEGYPFEAGGPLYATPALADIFGRARATWIVPRQDKVLALVEDPRPSVMALRYNTPWAVFQGSSQHEGSLNNVTKPAQVSQPTRPTEPEPKVTNATKSQGCQQLSTPASQGGNWLLVALVLLFLLSPKTRHLPPS